MQQMKMMKYNLASEVQLVGASSHSQSVVGLIPSQGTHLGCDSVPGSDLYDPWSGCL